MGLYGLFCSVYSLTLLRLSAILFGKQVWLKTEFRTKVLALIHNITEDRIRHASGPVQLQPTSVTFIGMFPRIKCPGIECLLYFILQAGGVCQPWSIGVPLTQKKLTASSSSIDGHLRHVLSKKSYHKIMSKSHFGPFISALGPKPILPLYNSVCHSLIHNFVVSLSLSRSNLGKIQS